jgi:hypothetical protein
VALVLDAARPAAVRGPVDRAALARLASARAEAVEVSVAALRAGRVMASFRRCEVRSRVGMCSNGLAHAWRPSAFGNRGVTAALALARVAVARACQPLASRGLAGGVRGLEVCNPSSVLLRGPGVSPRPRAQKPPRREVSASCTRAEHLRGVCLDGSRVVIRRGSSAHVLPSASLPL